MAQPKTHTSHAERQAAYRQRCQEAVRQRLQEKGLPALPPISTMPGVTRWRKAIASATTLLSMVSDEMETYHGDRSADWQESDRGESFSACLEAVTEARDAVAELTIS